MRTTTQHFDQQIIRARLTIWLSDGSSLQTDGKPDKGTVSHSLDMGNMFAGPEESAAQLDRILNAPDWKATADIAWTNPTMVVATRGLRGWWWRLKAWLKDFPIS